LFEFGEDSILILPEESLRGFERGGTLIIVNHNQGYDKHVFTSDVQIVGFGGNIRMSIQFRDQFMED
jgi:hypothetical protein